MTKQIKIDDCMHCPYRLIAMDDKQTCWHPKNRSRIISPTQELMPEWCPLDEVEVK